MIKRLRDVMERDMEVKKWDGYLHIGVEWEEMKGLRIVEVCLLEKMREEDGKLGMSGNAGERWCAVCQVVNC